MAHTSHKNLHQTSMRTSNFALYIYICIYICCVIIAFQTLNQYLIFWKMWMHLFPSVPPRSARLSGPSLRQVTFLFLARRPPWVRTSSFTRCLDHTQRRATVGRTPLDEWSACRRDLYLITYNTHNDKHPTPGGIRTHSLSKRAAAALRLRPRGH